MLYIALFYENIFLYDYDCNEKGRIVKNTLKNMCDGLLNIWAATHIDYRTCGGMRQIHVEYNGVVHALDSLHEHNKARGDSAGYAVRKAQAFTDFSTVSTIVSYKIHID